MTGRIEKLATSLEPGSITTNSGPAKFRFAYRRNLDTLEELTVGQLVSFEIEKGTATFAVGVRPKELGAVPAGSGPAGREIRYQGFEQTRNIRSYKFQAWRSGEENEEAIVTVDLALFRKHGIGIQEGPGICLRLVEAEFQESSVIDSTVWKRELTAKELEAHISTRSIPKNSRRKRS
jgi:hypothetical protein